MERVFLGGIPIFATFIVFIFYGNAKLKNVKLKL